MSLTSLETKILRSIRVPSENNPLRPEFPPGRPRFPATPTYRIKVSGFSKVWLKDESINPTGTHKDRMAWEIVVMYRNILLRRKGERRSRPLPPVSLISSGSAALAVQTMLRKYQLPALKALVDKNIKPKIKKALRQISCEIYETNLATRTLSSKEILKLTKNKNGIDITASEGLDPTMQFYDWMSYEMINEKPEYCFIPFGTGHLFENVMNVSCREVTKQVHDPRFKGNATKLRQCNFLGATSNNPRTLANKLYSPHLPFTHYNEQWLETSKTTGFCGPDSGVYAVKESFLRKALVIAHQQGIKCEPSGIAGLALLLQLQSKIAPQKKVLVVNTGCARF